MQSPPKWRRFFIFPWRGQDDASGAAADEVLLDLFNGGIKANEQDNGIKLYMTKSIFKFNN